METSEFWPAPSRPAAPAEHDHQVLRDLQHVLHRIRNHIVPVFADCLSDLMKLDPDALLCYEVPMAVVIDAFQGVLSTLKLPELLSPSLTIFEICVRFGCAMQVDELRDIAQQRLCQLIVGGRATLPRMLKLIRAGAQPLTQHPSLVVNNPFYQDGGSAPSSKRQRTETLPHRNEGTLLHLVCRAIGEPPCSPQYQELARWLCEIAPLSSLVCDTEGLTPLQLVLDYCPASKTGDADATRGDSALTLCALCGVRGHSGGMCMSSGRAPRKPFQHLSLLKILAEGFARAVDMYPWRANSLFLGAVGSKVKAALKRARTILLDAEAIPDQDKHKFDMHFTSESMAFAADSLDRFICFGDVSCGSSAVGEAQSEQLSGALCNAVEHLGGLAAARARGRVVNAVAAKVAQDLGNLDSREANARLAAREQIHKSEVAGLEKRTETLEGELVALQRQLEEAEARAEAFANAPRCAPGVNSNGGNADGSLISQPSIGAQPAHAAKLPEVASTPEAFVARLRRERLVDAGDINNVPASVRAGIANLSRSLCAAVERLAEDLYESECHFIYEIVQNAEDAHRRDRLGCAEPSTLCLKVFCGPEGGYFVSESNEAGFTEADVAAICDISASSKQRSSSNGSTIGCKGIGFKSVFTVSDRPHVLSRGFTFVFDVTGPLGKLGYVTPTWLSPVELAALPQEVLTAHAAGRTVLYLPLKRYRLAADIQLEMDEFADQGRATLLFLKHLEIIELVQGNKKARQLRRRLPSMASPCDMAISSVEEAEEDSVDSLQHRYHVYHHAIHVKDEPLDIDLTLAFPLPASPPPASTYDGDHCSSQESATIPARPEPIFCSLPVRFVGFGFAVHCNRFNLVANRGDLHRGSAVNRAIRDAGPAAFASACAAFPSVAERAIALLGEPVADPFWRPAREGILEELVGVECVATAAGARRPTEVLLLGSGTLREAASLLPAELLVKSCGRALASATDSEERLLRRLGAQVFSFAHLCQCLAHEDEQWPQGWIAAVWQKEARDLAIATLRTIYRCIAATLLDSVNAAGASKASSPPPLLEDAIILTRIRLFPLESGICCALAEGAIFRSVCPSISQAAQLVLVDANCIRILPPALVESLDNDAARLLDALGIKVPTLVDLAKAALEVHLRLSPGDVARPVERALWASLELLCEIWIRSGSDSDPCGNVLEEAWAELAAVDSSICISVLDAERAGKTKRLDLAEVVLLPGRNGRVQGPSRLICPTFLGIQSSLAPDIIGRINAFLGIPFAYEFLDCAPPVVTPIAAEPEVVAPWPKSLGIDPLAWEAFLVHGLRMQPLRPLDSRQPRIAPDLALAVGKSLGDDGPTGLWNKLLDGTGSLATRILDYVDHRASDAADVAWLADLPVRYGAATVGGALRLRNMFLRSAYFHLAGNALEGAYLDLPLDYSSSAPSSSCGQSRKGSEVKRMLFALGLNCDVNIAGVASALIFMRSRGCRDVSAYARLYSALGSEDEEDVCAEDLISLSERILRVNIFHPDHPTPLKAAQCIWATPPSTLLQGCCGLISLQDIYKPFGRSRLRQYFAARGVPIGLSSAGAYLGALAGILSAAESLGGKWRTSPTPVGMTITLSSGTAVPADSFLDEFWASLLDIYRGMASLCGKERSALRPFSTLETLVVVPLTCPCGGPPTSNSMLAVACFHDGALFRRLAVSEAFWEVGPDLAHSRATEWALASFFPTELRDLFVNCLGVRESVDRATLRRCAEERRGRAVGVGRAGSSQWQGGSAKLVNESGLPADVIELASGSGIESFPRGRHAYGSVMEAATAAIASLRGRQTSRGRSHSRSRTRSRGNSASSGDVLVAAALPARSVRCPATRSRRLARCGSVEVLEGRRGKDIALYVAVDDEAGAGSHTVLARAVTRELSELALVLWKLSEDVFRVSAARVALVWEPDGAMLDGGCGHQDGTSSWPLLFQARLRREVGADPAFWFGEFCHALAHRAEGPEHSTQHARIAQALLAQHLTMFAATFPGVLVSALPG